MFYRPVKTVMQRRNIAKAPSHISVADAARLMAKKNVGAVLIVDDGRLVGIVSERDIVYRVAAKGLDIATTRVRDVMTAAPHTIEPDVPLGYALMIMHDKGFRHLPVIDAGQLVGIVSARSAMDPDLEEFESEAQRRRHFLAEHEAKRAVPAG